MSRDTEVSCVVSGCSWARKFDPNWTDPAALQLEHAARIHTIREVVSELISLKARTSITSYLERVDDEHNRRQRAGPRAGGRSSLPRKKTKLRKVLDLVHGTPGITSPQVAKRTREDLTAVCSRLSTLHRRGLVKELQSEGDQRKHWTVTRHASELLANE